MPGTHHLSKAKVLAGCGCHKRRWLEVHDPDKGEVSDLSKAPAGKGPRD